MHAILRIVNENPDVEHCNYITSKGPLSQAILPASLCPRKLYKKPSIRGKSVSEFPQEFNMKQHFILFLTLALAFAQEKCPDGFKEDVFKTQLDGQVTEESRCFQVRNDGGDFEAALKVYSEEGQILLEPKSNDELSMFRSGSIKSKKPQRIGNGMEDGFYVGIKSINNQ